MPEISIQDINIWTPEPQWILQEHKLIQSEKSQGQSEQINLKHKSENVSKKMNIYNLPKEN